MPKKGNKRVGEPRPFEPVSDDMVLAALDRGVYHDVPEPINASEHFITGYNERVQPLVWTNTGEQIPAKTTKQQDTSGTPHPILKGGAITEAAGDSSSSRRPPVARALQPLSAMLFMLWCTPVTHGW
jgi:hypothetical protein